MCVSALPIQGWHISTEIWPSEVGPLQERGLNTNHSMITEFTRDHKLDNNDIGEAIFKLHEKIEHLLAQIYDLQNQNCEYEYRFERMSLAVYLRIPETRSSFYDGEPMPWKMDAKPTTSTTPSSPPPKKEI